MKTFDPQYQALIQECLAHGTRRPTRSGVDALSVLGITIEHDMRAGFPLSTLRRLPEKSMRVETEFYLKGLTDRRWLQERGCHFWDAWNHPRHKDPDDIGPTYGFAWRHFGISYEGIKNYAGQGRDQIAWLLHELKTNPESKRLVVSQWDPCALEEQLIPPCPFAFQVLKYGEELNLVFYQRSADVALGLPNDFAQHALLLHLLCLETRYTPGKVIGMFGQAELYVTHLEGARKLLTRAPSDYPTCATTSFRKILDWSYADTTFVGYKPGEPMRFPLAV